MSFGAREIDVQCFERLWSFVFSEGVGKLIIVWTYYKIRTFECSTLCGLFSALCVLYWSTPKSFLFFYILSVFSIFEKWNFHMWCVCLCVRVFVCVCVCVVGLFMGYLMCSVSAATKRPLTSLWKWAILMSLRWSFGTELGSVTLPSVSAIVHPWVRLFHWHRLSASWHHCACFSLQCHMLCCLCLETTALVRLFYYSASCVLLSVSWTDLPAPTSLMCTFQKTTQDKIRKCFGKKCRWMDRKGRNKQGRNPWIYGYILTYSRL